MCLLGGRGAGHERLASVAAELIYGREAVSFTTRGIEIPKRNMEMM